MKPSIRNLICMLSVMLLLIGIIVPVAADGIISDSEIVIPSAPEQAVRNAVETYFEQRNSFLHGVAGSYPAINDWYVTDLTKHRTAMAEAGVTRLEAILEITDLHIYYKETHVYATEHLVYEKNGTAFQEEVFHDFLLMESSSGWKVVDDAYYEAASDFASCAYIPPESSLEQTGVGDGSASCIVNVANGEIGYVEISDNNTKYCTWYGMQTEWCVIFVEWCGYQADVSSSIIPHNQIVVSYLKNFFSNRGRYYSKSEYTPKPGDIAIFQDADGIPSHTGIVVQVGSNIVYCVEGNTYHETNKDLPIGVYRRNRPLTGYYVLGFCVPAYSTTSHTSLSAWSITLTHHSRSCENCGTVVNREPHNFVDNPNTGMSTCSDCGYTILT